MAFGSDPLLSCWLDSLWIISCQVNLDVIWLFSHPLWCCCGGQLVSGFILGPALFLQTDHSHCDSVGLIACEWCCGSSSWVPSYILTFTVGLTGSEEFHHMYSCMPTNCPNTHSGLLAQQVSDFMPGPGIYPLTLLTPTLMLLTWQLVSHFMSSLVGCPLTVLTLTLVLLIQGVSDAMPSQTGCLLTVLTPTLVCWFDRKWVMLYHIHVGVKFWCLSLPLGNLTACESFHTTKSTQVPFDGLIHTLVIL